MLGTDLTNEQRRDIARRHFETAEIWLRKVIHHQLTSAYGDKYFSAKLEDQSWVIKSEIRNYVADRRSNEPGRFARDIDATTFGQAVQIATNTRYYNQHFRPVLEVAYPNGGDEARTFLTRIENIRNKVGHVGTCSLRELEQAICYSNDFIESAKAYFSKIQMDRVYNVPTITRFVDSLGNESHLQDVSDDIGFRIIDWRARGNADLRPGERLKLEIEVDESFSPQDYTVHWQSSNFLHVVGCQIDLEIQMNDVNEQHEIRAVVTSKRQWHRHGAFDDLLTLIYRVLPPP